MVASRFVPPAITASNAASSAVTGAGSGSSAQMPTGKTYGMTFSADTQHADASNGVIVDDYYCRYNATDTDEAGCKKPRGCRACLRVTGCMLDSQAECVSASVHYNSTLDFRGAALYQNDTLGIRTSLDYWNSSGAFSEAVQNWIFPSTMVNYCEPNETTCDLCRSSIFTNNSGGGGGDMRYCVGTNGCICASLCESPDRDWQLQNQTVCEPKKLLPKKIPPALMWVLGSMFTLLICSGLYYWMWKRTSDDIEESVPDPDEGTYQCSKDCSLKSEAPTSCAPCGPDTPVMEVSGSEFSRFSDDSSRRQGRYALESQKST